MIEIGPNLMDAIKVVAVCFAAAAFFRFAIGRK